MLEKILSEVRGQVEQSDPPVRAAALLHLARVLTAFDQAEAENVLERGIALTLEIPKPANDALIPQAVTLAALFRPHVPFVSCLLLPIVGAGVRVRKA
jgi:hypothetical protein